MVLHKAIVDLEDFTESVNILVYGDSGVGKTVLGGTAPRCLIIRAEDGAISAYRQGSEAKVWPVTEWSDFEAAYAWCEENTDEFDWIVIDSLTKVQELALRSILKRAVADNPSRDPDIPAIQDHQKWQNMLKRYVVMFNDLPQNVMWTALAMHKEDQEGQDIVLPLILGKNYDISASICAEMNVVGYLSVETVKQKRGDVVTSVERRELLVKSRHPFFAKDRYGVLGNEKGVIVNPTMPDIIAAINAPPPKVAAKKAAVPTRRATARRPA